MPYPIHDLALLAAQIAAFAGAPPLLDSRLQLAECAAPVVAWAGSAHAGVSVTCAAPVWRLYVPVGVRGGPAAIPLVRRGDAVTIAAPGRGFSVSLDAVAEHDAAAGDTVRVRARGNGARLLARVGAGGTLTAAGYNDRTRRR